jgi:hypothetical protein
LSSEADGHTPAIAPGARQTDALVLVEAADHCLELFHTPEETKARRPKVYYRVELAEGILRGAERDPTYI